MNTHAPVLSTIVLSTIASLAVAALCCQPARAEAPSAETLGLMLGKSVVLDFPSDIRQISTSDPAIVDAVAVSTREIMLNAKGLGVATVVVWSKTGERAIYAITVEQNLDPVRRLLRDTFPGEEIEVRSSRDAVSLTGRASTKEIADRAVALVTPFGKTIVNNLAIAPPPADKQIVLRVRFAELNRKVAKSFGVNLLSTGAGNTVGGTTTGQFTAPKASSITGTIPGKAAGFTSEFSISDALNIFAFRPDLNLGAFIKALQAENLLQVLAEPNLVTTAGKEASFLVGGEFPVPVLQGSGNAGAVTVQFREFGIRLTFTPTVTADNTVKLHVRPEVSAIDIANAVTISGFLIPALSTRRMDTNIELGMGQSFLIAGLIDNRMQETINRVPGLSSIPLLGQLFKSFDTSRSETELVVIVTPELTQPLPAGQPLPGPAFPKEFLVPYKTDQKRSESKDTTHTRPAQLSDLKSNSGLLKKLGKR